MIDLRLGDCIEVMKTLPDKSIDFILTSPPYNCGIRYNSYNDRRRFDEYYLWCEEWLRQFHRLLKDDGRACIVHYLSLGSGKAGFKVGIKNGTSQDDDFRSRHAPLMKINCIAENIGLRHHGVAIWWDITLSKRTAWGSWLSASAPYINSPFEGILVLYKERWKKDNKGITQIEKEEFMESCSGVWKIAPEHNREHPAPFPEKLASRCIRLFTYEGDTVLDPFNGSGTTTKVAKDTNRNAIGIELDPVYMDIAKRRISD